MSASSTAPSTARSIARLRVTLAAVDVAVQSAAERLEPDVRERWARYRGAVQEALASVERASPERVAETVEALTRQLRAWGEALWARGVWPAPSPSALSSSASSPSASAGFDGFISPSRARARMDRVDAEVTNLDRHIRRHKHALGRAFVAGWERWRDAWRQFYARYPRDWDWWYLGNASAWNETLSFEQRLAQFAEALERAGVRSRLPAPRPPAERSGGSGAWLTELKGIAVAGAIGVTVLGTVYLVRRVGG